MRNMSVVSTSTGATDAPGKASITGLVNLDEIKSANMTEQAIETENLTRKFAIFWRLTLSV